MVVSRTPSSASLFTFPLFTFRHLHHLAIILFLSIFTAIPVFAQSIDLVPIYKFHFHGHSSTNSKAMAAGDLNNDGYNDILSVNQSALPQVKVYSGKTGGEILRIAEPNTSRTIGQSAAAVGDIDHDGYDDFSITEEVWPSSVGAKVYSGRDGREIFHLPINAAPVVFTTDVRTLPGGDIDGDQTPDILVYTAGLRPTNSINAYSGVNGRLINGITLPISLAQPAGDLNNDGFDDFLVADSQFGGWLTPYGKVTAFSGGSQGGELFTINGSQSAQWLGKAMAPVGDINNDQYDDFAVTVRNGLLYEIRVYSGIDQQILLTLHENADIISIARAGDVNYDRREDLQILLRTDPPEYKLYSLPQGALLQHKEMSADASFLADDLTPPMDVNGDLFKDLLLIDRTQQSVNVFSGFSLIPLTRVGSGCGVPSQLGNMPRLFMPGVLPQVGGELVFSVSDAPANSLGYIYLSRITPHGAYQYNRDCTFYLDGSSLFFAGTLTTDMNGQATHRIPIPNYQELVGVDFSMQVLFPTAATESASNGFNFLVSP